MISLIDLRPRFRWASASHKLSEITKADMADEQSNGRICEVNGLRGQTDEIAMGTNIAYLRNFVVK